MEKEIWKDIEGYNGKYKISNYGKIRSLCKKRDFIMKQTISHDGYYYVNLYGNKNRFNKIHRLVAIHFVENINNKPQVNHINGNKLNNHYQNLEWCTVGENLKHAYLLGLKIPPQIQRILNKAKQTD